MMSKAAFMMQDHVRRHYVMITDVHNPNTFFVRGRLPFPQGLMAIAALFKNLRPADVYAHPYFIEKQSDPTQPSPQLHLTEESQGVMKVMGGLRYMRDDNTKLDNTMMVVTDYEVEVEGRMPVVPRAAATAPAGPRVTAAEEDDASSSSSSPLTLQQRALLRRAVHHVTQIPGGGGDGGLGSAGARSSVGGAAPGASATSGAGALTTTPGHSTFPTAEDCAADAWASYRYLKAAVLGRRALEEEEAASATRRVDAASLLRRRRGGYTVLYNPIEVNERTMVELLLKLQQEERVVQTIIVPTRQAWRQLQVWADVFPDAAIISSGEVPLLPAATAGPHVHAGDSHAALTSSSSSHRHHHQQQQRGGCQDMGDGVMGVSFPEVDLAAEAAQERQRAAEAAATAAATAAAARHPQRRRRDDEDEEEEEDDAAAVPTGATPAEQERLAMQKRQQLKLKLRDEMRAEAAAAAAAAASTTSSAPPPVRGDNGGGDLVDVLWSDAALFEEKQLQQVGLRASDADRVRVLAPSAAGAVPVDTLHLTPTIELLRVPGDATTNEYVLYDANSCSLACTDLYHGQYADLDPANSWMCRVWFKFVKRGDYKRTDVVPRYKWLQVLRQRSLPTLQAAVDDLTRRRPIRCIVHAHGTPPLVGAEAANALRTQWNLPPLHPSEQPPP